MVAVVGRDRELHAVHTFLGEEADPGPRVLVFEGEPGIGKTTLWGATVELAEAGGHRVLSSAASEAEAQMAFTSLRDLLSAAFDEVADELPEPQRRALAVVLLREEPGAGTLDSGSIAVAVVSALRLLAARSRVLLAVDDTQWLDAASAAVLRYALRRLDDARVRFVVARRGAANDGLELERLPPGRVLELELGGISIGALGRLLHDRLGRTFARPALVRLHEVSGGNAFYAVEVARALPVEGPSRTLPVPASVREVVEGRLSALPEETVDALAVVAASGRATVDLVRAVTDADPAAVLAPAVAADVLHVDHDELRFAHPLFAAAVYDRVALRHRALHAKLAEVVADPEQRARHLARANATPSEDVARLVMRGAELAFARGSPAAAAELAAEAVRLTPESERDPATARALAEADYHFAAGDTVRASEVLDDLLGRTPAGAARARMLGKQGRIRHFEQDIRASVDLLYAALEEADGEARGEIEEGLAWGLLLSRRDLSSAAEHARSAVALATARDDRAALAEALAVQALADFVLGRPWNDSLERALALEDATLHLRVLRHPTFAQGYLLSCADEVDAARSVFELLRARAEESGDESSLPSLLNHLALVECLAGRWAVATEHAEDCYERALASRQRPTQRSILGKLALLATRRGDPDEARTKALEALGAIDPSDAAAVMEGGGETAVWALGSLALQLGDAEEAHRLLGPLTEALLAAGVREPGELRSLPDEIEALVLLGALDEAEALLDHLRAWSGGVDRPSVRAAAARCAGLLAAARGDGTTALAQLETAADAAARAALPFERGRTMLALGVQQRRARQRRTARATLTEALATFEELGADLLSANTRAELGRIGGRSPSGDGLTPSELRIAELVAEGKTNREVAAALVVSERTIESALTQVYRKLDVRSRTELARKLSGR